MMKNIFILLLVSVYQIIPAQNNQNSQEKEIIPPTPQAFEMIRYGNMPLNEYQGMPNISIPITEIKEKNISANLSLNYTKVGVKVADVPNSPGMNWLLQMGGVITRTVYDKADESPVTRLLFDNESQINALVNSPDGSNNAYQLSSYYRYSPIYDGEIDIFEFYVNGLSGKFYLDKDLNPVLLSKNSLVEIKTIGDFRYTHQFVLTAPDGVKYYFGGENAIEKTFIRSMNTASNNVTSFYLTRIKDVNNDEIKFNYSHFGAKAYWLSTDESIPYGREEQECIIGTSSNFYQHHTTDTNMLRVLDAILLTSIIGSEKSIELNYVSATNSTGRKIKSIVISNNRLQKKIQEFNFNYYDQSFTPNQVTRFFLTSLEKYNYDKNGNKVFDNEYAFTYYKPDELPENDSYSVDAYGYFNGNTNNTTYLPNLKQLHNIDIPNNYYYSNFTYADRTSNLESAKKGTLTSITYPTKGTTFFEYEGLPTREKTAASYGSYELNIYKDSQVTHNVDSLTYNSAVSIDNSITGTLTLQQDVIPGGGAPVSIKVKIVNKSNNETEVEKDLSLYQIEPTDPSNQNFPNDSREVSTTFDIRLSTVGDYEITLTGQPKRNANYTGRFDIRYDNGYRLVRNNIGLRLKRMYDEDKFGNKQNIKRLYYSSYKNIGKFIEETAGVYPTGYTRTIYNADVCINMVGDLPFPSGFYAIKQNILRSSPNSSMSWENFTKPFLYPNVTISYGGDNFEKGGEEKTFVTTQKENAYIWKMPSEVLDEIASPYIDLAVLSDYHRNFMFDEYNGKPKEIRQLINKNNSVFIKSKTSFTYDYRYLHATFGLIVKPAYKVLYAPPGTDINGISSNLAISSSPLFTYNTSITDEVEQIYYDDVPALSYVDEDDSTYKSFSITKKNVFNPQHYQLSSQETTYPDGSNTLINYKYAIDKSNTSDMIAANMVGIPLETEVKKNGHTISKTSVEYEQKWVNVIVPTKTMSYDLNALDVPITEVTYDEYDVHGNLWQYTTKDGVSTVIVWGYNQTKPIAKIVGATTKPVVVGRGQHIDTSAFSTIISLSDSDASIGDEGTESALVDGLDAFRKTYSNLQITTYTYDPLVGVRSITPPSGVREYYIYDTANRLEKVVDVNGNVLKEYQYNYKH